MRRIRVDTWINQRKLLALRRWESDSALNLGQDGFEVRGGRRHDMGLIAVMFVK
jgi:hypothetical protein